MDHSVFISYSSAEKAVADQICAFLETSGVGCWIAPRDIAPGADYPAAILAGIQQARAVVVVVSTASVTSPHILSEVGHAFSERKPIIPFRLSPADLPPDLDYFLSMSQWLDAENGCTPQNLALLKDAISKAQTARATIAPAKTAGVDVRVLLPVTLALVAAAAVTYWLWPSHKLKPDDFKTDDKSGNKSNDKSNDKKEDVIAGKPQPWVNPKDGLTYVWIPAGNFTMGCSPGDTECKPDEGPSHMVELPAGFWLGQTEVTNAAYQRIQTSWKFPPNEANLPVVDVSWRGAKSFCASVGGRLPTEAEWEYAARGGLTAAYYGIPSKIAWFAENSDGVRHPVATRQPNAYGLYDMLGNASEWVLDRYYRRYDIEAPAIGNVEQPLTGNASELARGGYWESEPENIRVSHRMEIDIGDSGPMVGIRCIAERK
jgi:formylglycine-generating enzyme required for sulfatase activity